MKRGLPWIGQTAELIDGDRQRLLGPARLLLDFYTEWQKHRDGRVYYGKVLTYRQIASRIPNCRSERTLERYNQRLRKLGYIATRTIVEKGEAIGFTVKILNQKKFLAEPAPAPTLRQGHLFAEPIAMPAREIVEKPVQKRAAEAVGYRQVCRQGTVRVVGVKDLRSRNNLMQEQTRAHKPRAISHGQKMAARRILGEIDRICEVYAGAFDPAELARRDQRLELLYSQLRMTGWQEERAG